MRPDADLDQAAPVPVSVGESMGLRVPTDRLTALLDDLDDELGLPSDAALIWAER